MDKVIRLKLLELLCLSAVVAGAWHRVGYQWAWIASSAFIGITLGIEACILENSKARDKDTE